MDVVGKPHKYLEAEGYYYVMIDTPNDMPSDINYTAKSLLVRRQYNKK